MTATAASIRIPGVTRLDELELRKSLGPDGVRFEKGQGANDDHGELATATAIVIVSLAALRVLAVYLVKSTDRKKFRKRVEVVTTSGERRSVEIEYSASSSQAPEAEVLKQLATACDVDAAELAKS